LHRVNSKPLHIIIDEAHLFAPQGRVPDPQSGRMVHAANNLVSGGRVKGLRIMLISQRPAKLHKDSLTQVETLIAMRLIAPQDRAAVEDSVARGVTGYGW
jgi:DNA helicase HerA-like ATPase